jgi:hypothetical protein
VVVFKQIENGAGAGEGLRNLEPGKRSGEADHMKMSRVGQSQKGILVTQGMGSADVDRIRGLIRTE